VLPAEDGVKVMDAVFTTNLRCQSCLDTIGPLLDSEPVVEAWEADLADADKLLRVKLKASSDTKRVVEILGGAGYTASLLSEPIEQSEHEEATVESFSFSTYKPLLLVVAYVLGATALSESIHGSFVWQRAMSYFMGYFFLGFAFFKLLDVTAFADAFGMYDIIAKRSRSYAVLYPWIELTLGLFFVTRTAPTLANVLTVIVMAVGLVGVIAALREKRTIQCACLGTVFNLPMTVVTVIENGAMIAMATTMLGWNLLS